MSTRVTLLSVVNFARAGAPSARSGSSQRAGRLRGRAPLYRRTNQGIVNSLLGALVDLIFLEVRRDGLHDLLGLRLVVDLERVEEARSAQLELGDVGLLALLDGDLVSLGLAGLLLTHDANELFQIFDFLGLNRRTR